MAAVTIPIYDEPVGGNKPLIVIVGPTASGKSAVALKLALLHDGEIICADSRTVYRGMDIGTAKPSIFERNTVPHHLLDVLKPNQSYNAAQFKTMADAAIREISSRGKVPILVGGTGLYIDAVLYDYAFLPARGDDDRDELEALSVEQLQKILTDRGIALPENSRNPRHLIRAIETNGAIAVKKSMRPNTLVVGIDRSKAEMEQRIRQRITEMLSQGLETEVRMLSTKYGWDVEAMKSVGYREWRAYFHGTQSIAETVRLIQQNTLQYVKRQRTWFKRNKNIHWITSPDEAEKIVAHFL